jgi:glyoxylase-like metal-dependent hydrolase (beta-lactamase superfamily II)
MLFRQYLHRNPVAISYFFGCGSKSQGVVVDPMEDQVDFYIQESRTLGMDIRYVIDTHLHADHISGARLLAEKTGAKYILHRSADVRFPFEPVEDGDEIAAGNTILKILHTPGHTPEHISILVTDRARGEEPWFVLTGHTLMVGDVGRTELATEVEEGAKQLFRSLHEKLLPLPDHLEIYPGAYSGSICGRSLSGKPSSTLGFEKKLNRALQIDQESDFVQYMTRDIPEKPVNYQEIRAYNMGLSDSRPDFTNRR